MSHYSCSVALKIQPRPHPGINSSQDAVCSEHVSHYIINTVNEGKCLFVCFLITCMSYDPVTFNPGHYRIILQGILKKRFYFTHTYKKKKNIKSFFFFYFLPTVSKFCGPDFPIQCQSVFCSLAKKGTWFLLQLILSASSFN